MTGRRGGRVMVNVLQFMELVERVDKLEKALLDTSRSIDSMLNDGKDVVEISDFDYAISKLNAHVDNNAELIGSLMDKVDNIVSEIEAQKALGIESEETQEVETCQNELTDED